LPPILGWLGDATARLERGRRRHAGPGLDSAPHGRHTARGAAALLKRCPWRPGQVRHPAPPWPPAH